MKCISAFLSLCLIAAFVVAQPNYDFSKLKREHLGRGVIAIRENPSTVAVSWRYLSSDPMDESFDVYRNGEKVNKHPIRNATFFQDIPSKLSNQKRKAIINCRPMLRQVI